MEEPLNWVVSIKTHGFAIIPKAVGQRVVESLLEGLSHTSLPRSKAGVRHAMRFPAIRNFAHGTPLLEMAREIFGTDVIPFRATLFDKSPTANWLVVWHQDTALPLRKRLEVPGWGPWSMKEGVNYAHAPASALEQVVALRLHLNDSTSENGPLRVLPRTHTLGVLTDDQIRNLAGRVEQVECLVPRGGVLAMRPLIVHASSKSATEAPRSVLHIEYARVHGLSDGLELAIA